VNNPSIRPFEMNPPEKPLQRCRHKDFCFREDVHDSGRTSGKYLGGNPPPSPCPPNMGYKEPHSTHSLTRLNLLVRKNNVKSMVVRVVERGIVQVGGENFNHPSTLVVLEEKGY